MKRRTVSLGVFAAALLGWPPRANGNPVLDDLSEPLVLEDGDGDASWLHERHLVQHISPSWFSGRIVDWYGSALLFQVVSDNHAGDLVALTPRTRISIADQLKANGVASVIVHRFDCDAPTLEQRGSCGSAAIGMTVLRRQDDTRFSE